MTGRRTARVAIDRLGEFIEDSKHLVGQPAQDVPQGSDVADFPAIGRFCGALSDANPLYRDPGYGVVSPYNSLIAPPTFVLSVRTPTSSAAFDQKQYGLIRLAKSVAIEWVDVIRVGDRLTSDISITGVREAGPLQGRRTAEVDSQATYSNSYGGVIGSSRGTMRTVPFQSGDPLLSDRDIYRYSDQEIARMERDLESEVLPRGRLLRYWDDASVGEKLPALIKPHLTIPEIEGWVTAEAKPLPRGSLTYFELKAKPGRTRVNPTTHWPYMDMEESFSDINSCAAVGFKTPANVSLFRAALAGQLMTDWMGDDGFLRRLEVELTGYWLYGDSMWLTAEVVDKYKERVGGEMYHAVDVRVQGANQLGETLARGSATVYLPNPGHPVTLPIPH